MIQSTEHPETSLKVAGPYVLMGFISRVSAFLILKYLLLLTLNPRNMMSSTCNRHSVSVLWKDDQVTL